MGIPHNGGLTMEYPIQMDDWGGTPMTKETSMTGAFQNEYE